MIHQFDHFSGDELCQKEWTDQIHSQNFIHALLADLEDIESLSWTYACVVDEEIYPAEGIQGLINQPLPVRMKLHQPEQSSHRCPLPAQVQGFPATVQDFHIIDHDDPTNSANWMAIPRPIPRPEPVMMAIFLSIFVMVTLS